jgi:hypothetical protein
MTLILVLEKASKDIMYITDIIDIKDIKNSTEIGKKCHEHSRQENITVLKRHCGRRHGHRNHQEHFGHLRHESHHNHHGFVDILMLESDSMRNKCKTLGHILRHEARSWKNEWMKKTHKKKIMPASSVL